jgi:hypothetical protein
MPRLPPPPLVGPLKTRVRAMRFAIWAASLDHVPSNAEVAEFLGIHLNQAQRWRADWIDAQRPAVWRPEWLEAHKQTLALPKSVRGPLSDDQILALAP